jgi:hypothetical protein
MHGPVVDVGGDGWHEAGENTGSSVFLLLIANEVLYRSNDRIL